MYADHDCGDIQILSCSQLLDYGYDSPSTRVLIDCYPTESMIRYQQRAGRIQRIHESKPDAIYLDFAGNVRRFGPVEDLRPVSLHKQSAAQKYTEESQVEERKKKSVQCPKCAHIGAGLKCANCGFEFPAELIELQRGGEVLQELDMLQLAKDKKAREHKAQWLHGLIGAVRSLDYKDGFVTHCYKDRFGMPPGSHSLKLKEFLASNHEVLVDAAIQEQANLFVLKKSKYRQLDGQQKERMLVKMGNERRTDNEERAIKALRLREQDERARARDVQDHEDAIEKQEVAEGTRRAWLEAGRLPTPGAYIAYKVRGLQVNIAN
jgi:hypothetical protein